MASTEVTPIESGKYPALTMEPAEVRAIIEENTLGQQVAARDLPRIVMPAGGATTWEIPGRNGIEPSAVLSGILVHVALTRAYWPHDSNSKIPVCVSEDQLVGVGDPGGSCRSCPLAEWGTKVNEKTGELTNGQACSAKEVWFLLRDGFLPVVVALPTMSLEPAKNYRVQKLGYYGVKRSSVVTEIRLKRAENPAGDPYAIIEPSIGAPLEPEEAARAEQYAKDMAAVFASAASEITGSDTTDAG
jgi:hypothetical protein